MALRNQEFRNYLKVASRIKEIVCSIDPDVRVYVLAPLLEARQQLQAT